MDKILHYDISQQLSDSGYSRTYLALDSGLQKPVVLKLFPPERTQHGLAERLESLADSSTSVGEVGLAEYFQLNKSDQGLVLIRQFIQGDSIDKLVFDHATGSHAANYTQFLYMIRGAALALNGLHTAGNVHGNLKPSNIFRDNSGQIWLTDHGLETPGPISPDNPNWPATLPYLAPELLSRWQLTEAADLYALGASFYRHYVGQPPFPTDDHQACVAAVKSHELSFESQSVTPPGEIRLLLTKLVAKDPLDRFATAGELLMTLDGMISYVPETPVAPGKRKLSPRQYLSISILVLLLIIFWLVVTIDR